MRNERALQFRRAAQLSAQRATDAQAMTMPILYDDWAPGVAYGGKDDPQIVRRQDGLYRIRAPHTSQIGWEPEITPAMWHKIDMGHAGTREDPIPYDGNMILVSGLHYAQDGMIFLCTRDTVNPVYDKLSALVGLYVEVIT